MFRPLDRLTDLLRSTTSLLDNYLWWMQPNWHYEPPPSASVWSSTHGCGDASKRTVSHSPGARGQGQTFMWGAISGYANASHRALSADVRARAGATGRGGVVLRTF